MYAYAFVPLISGCRFVQNHADAGGGMLLSSASAEVSNSVFVGNWATYGGAVYNWYSSGLSLFNASFNGNYATGSGGAFWSYEASTAVINSIIWESSPAVSATTAAGSVSVVHSDVQGGYAGTGNIDATPMFVDAASGDFHLQAGSPCIDSANGDSAPSTDMEGNPRVDDPATGDTGIGVPTYADMGAYEYQP